MATKKISDLQLISIMADDVNIPGENTSQTYRLTGAQLKAYIQAQIADLMKSSHDLQNLGLSAAVSGNALTINLKQLDGSSAPSSTGPVSIGFRGTMAANGDISRIQAVAATSLVISSGSTMGHRSAKGNYIYIYALNNGGTIELAASSKRFDDGSVVTTTAEGGAGAADSFTTIYSTTARTGKAIRLIGRLYSSQTTAGTWAAAPTEISVAPFQSPEAYALFTSAANSGAVGGTDTITWTNTQEDADSGMSSGVYTFAKPGKYVVKGSLAGVAGATTAGLLLTMVWSGPSNATRTCFVHSAPTSGRTIVAQVLAEVRVQQGDTVNLQAGAGFGNMTYAQSAAYDCLEIMRVGD
jgi:hypothetical protein